MLAARQFARRAALAAVLTAAAIAHAGPLDPPPGPIVETGRFGPRIEVNAVNTPGDADSVYKITQPGSYYLAANLTGVSGRHGIEIAASDVTLDLGGFQLVGVPGALDGIFYNGAGQGLKVLNGSIRSWPGDGLNGNVAASATVQHVVCISNGGWGMRLSSGGIVDACIARANAGGGIRVTTAAIVRGSAALFNGGTGIEAFAGSTLYGNTASSNGASGVIANGAATIVATTAHSNIGHGIQATQGATITACSANLNTLNGIDGGNGSTVSNCTVTSNSQDGIQIGWGSTVSNCTARLNAISGIEVTGGNGGSLVLYNTCNGNGTVGGIGGGIIITSSSNRIEGNLVSENQKGMFVGGGDNLVIRNSASLNFNLTNYSINGGGNHYGPVVNPPDGTPGVVGSSGPSSLSTTDPWANFSHGG